MKTGFLKHGFRVMASCKLRKMLKMPASNFNQRHHTSEQRLFDSLDNSRCRTNRLKLILCSLSQIMDVTDQRCKQQNLEVPRN